MYQIVDLDLCRCILHHRLSLNAYNPFYFPKGVGTAITEVQVETWRLSHNFIQEKITIQFRVKRTSCALPNPPLPPRFAPPVRTSYRFPRVHLRLLSSLCQWQQFSSTPRSFRHRKRSGIPHNGLLTNSSRQRARHLHECLPGRPCHRVSGLDACRLPSNCTISRH